MKVYALNAENEEQLAVITARTSRSPSTFDVISEEVKRRGHVDFIKTNVLGYGHDSVAEMAQCPAVGIEDVSDLAANIVALADPQLVVQMTSTRYQDMASRRCTWSGGDASAIGEGMKAKYNTAMETVERVLNAMDHVKKRTLQCDIARAFLPAGVSTQFAIRGNARVMRDVVSYCIGHEMDEVRDIGRGIHAAIKEHIEVLFDRHVTPAAAPVKTGNQWSSEYEPGDAEFVCDIKDIPSGFHRQIADELRRWKESGWRRRMRMQAAPVGPFWSAVITSDWGAYRDLRRNRTLSQSDVVPHPGSLPEDALWAFRELYPDVCENIEAEPMTFAHSKYPNETDPYHAPMGSILTWEGGGHIFNWAYAFRLRSYAEAKNVKAGCHPAYALPMRNLMVETLQRAPQIAEAMGIVKSSKSLCGVEFEDRVPA
jgi:hypothetical protein